MDVRMACAQPLPPLYLSINNFSKKICWEGSESFDFGGVIVLWEVILSQRVWEFRGDKNVHNLSIKNN